MSEGFKVAEGFVRVGVQDDTEEGTHSLLGGLKGKLVAGAGALGLGAIIAKSVSDGLDISAGRAKLTAQLGLTKTQAGVVGEATGKLFAQGYGDSMDQINEATKSVIQNIGGMRDASSTALQDVSGKALNVANIFDQDLPAVTAAAGQLIKTGLAKNADDAFDIITKGFQVGDDKAGDFLDTLNEYGTQFRKMGIDGATATGIIQQGLQAGARDGDLVADAVKEFSIRAVDGSTTTAQGFKALGLSGQQMSERIAKGGKSASDGLQLTLDRLRGIKDPAKQAQAATNLFGTQAEDLGKALYAINPSTAVKGIGQVKGAADAAGKSFNDNARSNMSTFFRTIQMGAVNVIGGRLVPALTWMSGFLSNDVAPVIENVTGFLSDNRNMIIGVAMVVGPAVAAFVAWRGAVAAWQLVTKIATGVQVAFNAVMDANPIMLVVIGLAALVGGLILAYNKVGWFRDFVNVSFHVVAAVAQWLWGNVIRPVFSAIADHIGLVAGLVRGYVTVWVTVFRVQFAIVTGVINGAIGVVRGFGTVFGTVYSTVSGWVGKIVGVVTGIPGKIMNAGSAMLSAGKNLINNLWNGITSAAGSVGGVVADIGNAIKNGVNNLLHLPIKLPRVNTYIPGVGTIGGETLLPALAGGGRMLMPGYALVGENGPEIRKLGAGDTIYPNGQFPSEWAKGGNDNRAKVHVEHLHITVEADDITKAADVLRIINEAADLAATGTDMVTA